MKPAYTSPALRARIRAELSGNAGRDLRSMAYRLIKSPNPADAERGRLILEIDSENKKA